MQTKNKDRYIWGIRFIIALAVFLIGIYFVLSKQYFDTEYNKIRTFKEIGSVELEQGDVLEQTMFFNMDKIHSLGICAVNRTNNCTGIINVSLLDENNNIILQENVNAESLQLQKITWFDIGQEVEQQKKYTLRISVDKITGMIYIGTIGSDMNSDGVETNAVKNAEEISESLVVESTFYKCLNIKTRILILVWTVVLIIYILGFERLFRNKKRSIITLALTVDMLAVSMYLRVGFEFKESLNYVMFAGLIAAFTIIGALHLFLLSRGVKRAENYFVISTLILGIVYSLILQPFSMPDEEFHFAEAYRLSNAIMGQPVNDENGYIYMRECDINERVSCPDNSYTVDMLKALIRGNNDRSENMVPSECSRNIYSPIIMYIPQAIGITVGRLLHVNYVRLIFLGRLMNLLMFTFITYWAIRIIPFGKWIFFVICQIPMLLESVSSLSYDTLILALTFFFIAYLLKLYAKDEKINLKQIGVLIIIAFVYATLKPVYIPLIALVFLLPDKKISNNRWKSVVCKASIMGVGLLSALLLYKFSFMSMLNIQDDIIHTEVQMVSDEGMAAELTEIYQITDNIPYELPNIKFIMENPFDLIESYMGAFLTYADEYFLALFGCGLGRLWDLHNPMYIGILMMLLLCISYKKDNGNEDYIIKIKGRLWTIFLTAGSCFAVFLSMYFAYTQPDIKVIRGVQGRYMLPLLMVLPLFLRKRNTDEQTENTGIVMSSLTIQILAILSVCMEIWNR